MKPTASNRHLEHEPGGYGDYVGKRILFTEQELKRKENTFGKKLGRGLKKAGNVARKEITRQAERIREENKTYNEAYRKEKLKQIQRNARDDARKRFKSNKKGRWELPF